MYKYKEVKDNVFVLSLDNHVEVAEALDAFCNEMGILAGTVNGLGAVSEATFRFLDPATMKYVDKTFSEQMEITNLTGNISQKDGKPYLCASGAEKIARLCGVGWDHVRCEKILSNDEKGQFYYFEYTGDFYLGNDRISAVGTCSQKDQFFAMSKGQMKPASEIDETNIRKAAYSNMLVNGITRILGIRNLTWEELTASGIDRSKVQGVNYKTKKDHSNDMPEDTAQWVEWLKKQESPKDYYGIIKNSTAPQEVKRACIDIMYPKNGGAQ